MPPKGRRGSDLTMPLTKTEPASISAARASPRPESRGPEARAQAEAGAVRQLDRLVGVPRADHRRHRAEGLLVEGGHAGPDAGEHGRRVELALRRSSRWPPVRSAAPASTERRTWSSRSSSRSSRASGPTSVARSSGSPTFRRLHGRDELLLEAVGDRLVDDEALGRDAALAGVDRARPGRLRAPPRRSASARTMNGSEPPSSSTVFLSCRPASAATSMPGLVAAGQGHGADRRVADQRRDPRGGDQERREDALGEAGVAEDLLDREGACPGRWRRA